MNEILPETAARCTFIIPIGRRPSLQAQRCSLCAGQDRAEEAVQSATHRGLVGRAIQGAVSGDADEPAVFRPAQSSSGAGGPAQGGRTPEYRPPEDEALQVTDGAAAQDSKAGRVKQWNDQDADPNVRVAALVMPTTYSSRHGDNLVTILKNRNQTQRTLPRAPNTSPHTPRGSCK
jgi:hypothetical protein